ncbi:MAG: hypothetical protein E3J66_05625 [Dehalococcoidia bacterium]|nr:MAG: hypothetical protein E3J66_05625 [Dehalococcoidia bacterium]
MAKVSGARGRLIQEIEGLSEEKVKVVADFAAFVRDREEWLATLEILGNKQLTEAIRMSRDAWSQGKRAEFVKLSELNNPWQQNV